MVDSPTNDYLELVVDIHDRQYQRYSIDNSVYHLPVDEVGKGLIFLCLSTLFPQQREGLSCYNHVNIARF